MFVRMCNVPMSHPRFGKVFSQERDFDELFDSFVKGPAVVWGRQFPAIDVAEDENGSVVVAELPGVRKEDLKLSVHDGTLTIAGERKLAGLPENAKWVRGQFRSGSFSRSVTLPHAVNAEEVTAELSNGILRVVLPRPAGQRAKEIKVQ